MARVEMVFSSFSNQHDAAPGDRKKVDESEVPGLVNGGIAAPATQSEAEKAGVPRDAAASKR